MNIKGLRTIDYGTEITKPLEVNGDLKRRKKDYNTHVPRHNHEIKITWEESPLKREKQLKP